jgi:hypothetical protein
VKLAAAYPSWWIGQLGDRVGRRRLNWHDMQGASLDCWIDQYPCWYANPKLAIHQRPNCRLVGSVVVSSDVLGDSKDATFSMLACFPGIGLRSNTDRDEDRDQNEDRNQDEDREQVVDRNENASEKRDVSDKKPTWAVKL